jgi:lipoprotein signal peptidase
MPGIALVRGEVTRKDGLAKQRYLSVMFMLLSRDVSLDSRLSWLASRSSAAPAVQPRSVGQRVRARPGVVVFGLIVAIVVLDQAVKWWAWRHVPWARINPGGDILVGRKIGTWYADPVTGALLDLLDFGVLSIAVSVLVRPRTAAAVRVLGALMVGGWSSNLLDRLGVHYWTAPGSVRGVVDFIHLGGHYYNVADFFIIGGTPLFLLAVVFHGVRAAWRRAPAERAQPRARSRVRLGIAALVGTGLVLAVGLGAANYGGVNAAACTSAGHNDGSSMSVSLPSC